MKDNMLLMNIPRWDIGRDGGKMYVFLVLLLQSYPDIDVNMVGPWGWTPLTIAAYKQDMKIFEYLLVKYPICTYACFRVI